MEMNFLIQPISFDLIRMLMQTDRFIKMRAMRITFLADISSSMIVTGVLRCSAPMSEQSHAPAACLKGVEASASCATAR